MDEIMQLAQWMEGKHNTVFFSGSGTSIERGFPAYTDTESYCQEQYALSCKTVIEHNFFRKHPDKFYHFYKNHILAAETTPGPAHYILSQWEREGLISGIITENIDGLHRAAGSRFVMELLGNVHRNYCRRCGRQYNVSFIKEAKGIPLCRCGGIIKPDHVLFGETMEYGILQESLHLIQDTDVLILAGCEPEWSLVSKLSEHYNGDKLVIINESCSDLDQKADLIIRRPISETLTEVRDALENLKKSHANDRKDLQRS